ncbi:hypothetical protein AALO_G00035470 [Alosa alosa]|uniref:Fibronectin type-III domain-containing protein n=1 Tax=Alosa alosa TaxID=278164 RepID=A0AAV6HAM4_9TELE|nr:hypothetical protein AALO_G00035470 [Alosa alosa]
MMKLLLLAVWMVSCSCAVMPPTNLTVESQNFNHTLHWIPAAGTPPGTEYCIYLSDDDNQSDTLLSVTRATSLPVSVFMKEDIYKMYTLSVRAKIYNHTGCVLLVTGFFLSPETVDFDAVCVSSDCVPLAQRGRTPARKHPLSDGAHSEDEEEEEDEDGTENCGYMDRAAPPSASSQDALGPDATTEQYYGSCSPTGNVEQLQGQPEVEGHSDRGSPDTGYLATHKGSVYSHAATDEDDEEEEEDEEEEDYSGYMTRQ